MDSAFCTTWCIEENTVEGFNPVFFLLSSSFCISQKYSCIHLHSLYIGCSLETGIVHELVIAYLVLLYGCDSSSIIHHGRHLGRLRSWSCTDIKDRFTLCWCECKYWEHRCDRLEVYLPIVECSGSLDRIFMDSIEYIESCESVKTLSYDSFFFEVFEYFSSISLQSIDTKRTFSLVGKGIYNTRIIFS